MTREDIKLLICFSVVSGILFGYLWLVVQYLL